MKLKGKSDKISYLMVQNRTEGSGVTPPSEFNIGSKVIILQHDCFSWRLGSYGRVTEMKGTTPVKAKCDDCGQLIGVDIKAMQELSHSQKPKT